MVFSYSFDPTQTTKIREKDRVYAVPSTAATFEIVRLDEGGELDVKIGIAKLDAVFGGTPPAITSFIPNENEGGDGWGRASEDGGTPPAITSFIPNENVPDDKLRDSVQQ